MTCKQIAKLISEGRERELSLTRRLMIRVHLAMCIFCRRLQNQLEFIHGLSQAVGEGMDGSLLDDGGVFEATLPNDARTRIKKILAHKST
jgi:hypothetical protein